MSKAIAHPPGIYFGMPEDEYHADEALGSTALKALALDPIEYQHSKLHGKEPPESFALKWGSAIHCRVLEGAEPFARRFAFEPDRDSYPGLLDTMEELKKRCQELGVKSGTSKASATAAIRDFDQNTPIWDEIISTFKAAVGDRTILPHRARSEIERAAEWMQRDSRLGPVMENGTLVAGASEVSIFYEDGGVRLKMRGDHLLAHALLDVKSFRPVFAERVLAAALKAIARMRYDLQAAAYMRALRHAIALYERGQVFNYTFDPRFLEEVFGAVQDGTFQWIWILIKASGAPQPVVRELDMKSLLYRNAENDIERAIEDYRANTAKFGPDADWVPDIPVEVIADGDFSPYAFL